MPRKLIRADNAIWRKVDDSVVIVNIEGTNILTLNDTAAFIWDQCDGTKNEEEIAEAMAETYDAGVSEIREDVAGTIKRLEEKGLVRQVEDK